MAQRAKRTICREGHPLVDAGLRRDGARKRFCPICLGLAGQLGGYPAQRHDPNKDQARKAKAFRSAEERAEYRRLRLEQRQTAREEAAAKRLEARREAIAVRLKASREAAETRAQGRLEAAAERKRLRQENPCPQGHPRTPENTYVSPLGYRQCRPCRDAQLVKQRAKPLGAPRKTYRKKTHCVHGHALECANLYISPKGSRFCRECQRMKDRKRR